MIIESNTTEELQKSIIGHYWSLFKISPEEFIPSWMEITDLTDRILTELDNPNLVLSGKLDGNRCSLEMNTTYKIKGSVILEGNRVLEDELIFKTALPLSGPEKGCNVTPLQGFVLDTIFTVNCSGWLAEHVNLTYTFRYASPSGMLISSKSVPVN